MLLKKFFQKLIYGGYVIKSNYSSELDKWKMIKKEITIILNHQKCKSKKLGIELLNIV